MMDQFYTPSGLAAFLVGAAKSRSAKLVADFAMGDGALLKAAEARWPDANLFGSDINPVAAESAGDLATRIEFRTLDFLDGDGNEASLKDLESCCDVVLLNPPFTCRGNTRFTVLLDKQSYTGSKALAFVARALQFLKPDGELLAILPASCISSQRDARLFEALRGKYFIEQVGEIRRNAFPGCSVGIVIVRARRRSLANSAVVVNKPSPLVSLKPYRAIVMRGCTSMHQTSSISDGVPVLHTADLRGGACQPKRWSRAVKRMVEGRVVLLPRVGRPDLSKVVLAELPPLSLSDCVIAIRSAPPGREAEMLRLIRSNWRELEKAYGGSCAPYLSMAGLKSFLMGIGIDSELTGDMRLSKAGAGRVALSH